MLKIVKDSVLRVSRSLGYDIVPLREMKERDFALHLGELLRSLVPDVFHVHGLDFPNQVRSLAKLNPGIPIILQDHDRPRLPRIVPAAGNGPDLSALHTVPQSEIASTKP